MLPSAEDIARATAPKPLIFGLTIANIPTMNLRWQYASDRKIVFEENLADTLRQWRAAQGNDQPPMSIGYPEPDAFFTVLFRSTVVGIECTIQSAAIDELAYSNRLTAPLMASIHKPGSLSKSMLDAYYNKMPAKVHENAALQKYDAALWNTVRQFYREVRNPLSHGCQLWDVKAESLRGAFQMFDQIYGWIDTWCDPHRFHKILGSTTFHALK